jgi:RNase P/RNase MRP subunit POP5
MPRADVNVGVYERQTAIYSSSRRSQSVNLKSLGNAVYRLRSKDLQSPFALVRCQRSASSDVLATLACRRHSGAHSLGIHRCVKESRASRSTC